MIDAYEIESKIAIYPRIVLSKKMLSVLTGMHVSNILKSEDGLYHLNYFTGLLLGSGAPGNSYAAEINSWFENVTAIINKNLKNTEMDQKTQSKWTWFAKEFRIALEKINPRLFESFKVSLQPIADWPTSN